MALPKSWEGKSCKNHPIIQEFPSYILDHSNNCVNDKDRKNV